VLFSAFIFTEYIENATFWPAECDFGSKYGRWDFACNDWGADHQAWRPGLSQLSTELLQPPVVGVYTNMFRETRNEIH
jgi:hypothetical protein